MTERREAYHAGGPTAGDRRLAARLDELWHELDQARAGLPNDALHGDVFTDLGAAQAALRRAVDKLLLAE